MFRILILFLFVLGGLGCSKKFTVPSYSQELLTSTIDSKNVIIMNDFSHNKKYWDSPAGPRITVDCKDNWVRSIYQYNSADIKEPSLIVYQYSSYPERVNAGYYSSKTYETVDLLGRDVTVTETTYNDLQDYEYITDVNVYALYPDVYREINNRWPNYASIFQKIKVGYNSIPFSERGKMGIVFVYSHEKKKTGHRKCFSKSDLSKLVEAGVVTKPRD